MGLWVCDVIHSDAMTTMLTLMVSEYEGMLSSEIKERNAKWEIWKDGYVYALLVRESRTYVP